MRESARANQSDTPSLVAPIAVKQSANAKCAHNPAIVDATHDTIQTSPARVQAVGALLAKEHMASRGHRRLANEFVRSNCPRRTCPANVDYFGNPFEKGSEKMVETSRKENINEHL